MNNPHRQLQNYAQAAAPAANFYTATPNDDADLPIPSKSLYIGVSGDLLVVPIEDDSDDPEGVLFENHPVGYAPLQVRRIMVAGSSPASGIVVLHDQDT